MAKRTNAKNIPLTLDLRDRLKSIVEAELNRLPELLDGLTPMSRLSVILKLLPLVIPKAQAVNYEAGEPSDWPTLL